MSFAAALAAIGARRDDSIALAELAELALAEGEEIAALAVILPVARRSGDARLWQWTGLLYRALDEHEPALDAFAAAVRISPDDAPIAHGRARVALEAGLDARMLFDAALKIGPTADVFLGQTAAMYAMGEGERALEQLATLLDRNSQWAQGHFQWAQLASMTGHGDIATATVDRALARHPRDVSLWEAAIRILVGGERPEQAWHRADEAIEATGELSRFALSRAAALSDAGENVKAAPAFDALGAPGNVHHAILLARHLIRAGDFESLADCADQWMIGEAAHHFWPYASIAWRMTNDARWQWLEGDERLISVTDLSKRVPIDKLAAVLRGLHGRSGRFLDQSVRGGTQTDGPLMSRLDPEIQALRTAIIAEVEAYRASLPPLDSSHPMLRHRREGRVRFAGSWSVRLSGTGHHSNHVHPQGWISSAFYVAVPEGLKGEEGWLTLGEPQRELIAMPPIRRIEPRPGQLVLFPSMMWHGTLPFPAGERLTVAFDVAPPRSS